MSEEKKYYVYVHRYASGPKQGEVFYVGKGSGNRYKSRGRQNPHWSNVVNKYGFDPEIVHMFYNEICALSFEVSLIKFLGRENLVNMTDGGEGVCGLVHSIESRDKMSGPRPNAKIMLRGKEIPEWWKDKLRNAKIGKRQSNEHAAKSRTAKLGKTVKDTSKFNLEKRKPVENSDGEKFVSVNEAARILSERLGVNVSQGNISMVLTGRRKTAYGFSWKYTV